MLGQPLDKRLEDLADLVQITVVVEVVGLDASDDGHLRPIIQKPSVVFVGFDHHRPVAQPRPERKGWRVGADQRQRVQSAPIQEPRHQQARGRLAVRPGDRDAAAFGHQLAHGFGELLIRQAQPRSFGNFRISNSYRGGSDHVVRFTHVFGRVIAENNRTRAAQRLDCRARREFAAADLLAHLQQESRQRTHAGAADTDHVHPLRLAQPC